jgi:deoxycytidylate deaminase
MGQAQQARPAFENECPAGNEGRSTSKTLLERLTSRQSEEIVIAFAGPVGCGIDEVIEATRRSLLQLGYGVELVKLSDCLVELAHSRTGSNDLAVPCGNSDYLERHTLLQCVARQLRQSTGDLHILAEFGVQSIFVRRQEREQTLASGATAVPRRVAYLLDQLKRPEEVELLRALYRNLFYLIGVTRPHEQRLRHLISLGLSRSEAERLIDIDRHEDSSAGQRLDKTLHLADMFVCNEAEAGAGLMVDRFIRLVHGDRTLSPSADEAGMYAAHAASLRSACLSRQVGAAIVNAHGDVMATGCNDVPTAMGGLYSSGCAGDQRCVHLPGRQCFNDLHKRKLQARIGEVLDASLAEMQIRLPQEVRRRALEAVYRETRVGSLTEFSRAVHAEMEAILAIARNGVKGLMGATLFSTTFPCHSCARHIVAAGIHRVVYIEPYDKSLAQDLHRDSIEFELNAGSPAGMQRSGPRIRFQHFAGVAPRLYAVVFKSATRKDEGSGRLIALRLESSRKVLPEYMDNYIEFEEAAMQHFRKVFREVRIAQAPTSGARNG